jgi:hypothetical protein
MESYLFKKKKKSLFSSGYSSRYFRLYNFQLHVYENHESPKIKATFDLRTCIAVDSIGKELMTDFQLSFQDGNTLLLRSPDRQTKKLWMNVLCVFNGAGVSDSIAASPHGVIIPIPIVMSKGLLTCLDFIESNGECPLFPLCVSKVNDFTFYACYCL